MWSTLRNRLMASVASVRRRPLRESLRASIEYVRRRPPLLLTAALAVLLVAAAVVGSAIYVASAWRGLPDPDAIARIGQDMDRATSVYDRNDRFVFSIARERRLEVSLDSIAPTMVQAILASEDRRFYSHSGYDVSRIFSAAMANLRRRRAAQGASTLTQQLARQSFLTPDKTIHRKLQELLLARRIEHAYPKNRILELYLNKVYFGDGLYGVEAAARGYLGKHASELSVADAALLAGLVKSPSSDAPTVNMKRAVSRRNVVLKALLDTGTINQDTWKSSRATAVHLQDGLRADDGHAQYFREQVRRELVDRFGAQVAYQGGLKVYSTLDMPMQVAAENVMADSLKSVEGRRRTVTRKQPSASDKSTSDAPLQGALLALDPVSGDIRAMIGGRSFADSSFNRAVQARRQPGSAFKPIVYAAALEAGYTPATILQHLDDPVVTREGTWSPEELHATGSSISVRTALRTSSNRAAVRTLLDVGINRALKLADNMGLGKLPAVPSLALGPGEVSLQALTAAYGAFANHGLLPTAHVIRRVEDRNGRLLFEEKPESHRVLSETSAFLMSSLLADVVNGGTAASIRSLGFTLPAAGKTGTTSDFNDAWFVGFTPKLVAGVWIGFDEPRTILPNAFASDVAVPAWANFMKRATRGDAPDWIVPPAKVTSALVCRLSGKLATSACEHAEAASDGPDEHRAMVYTEYFTSGTEPTEYCDLHAPASLLATAHPAATPGTLQTPTLASQSQAPAVVSQDAGEEPPPPAPAPEEPKKKRSIWAKIFGGSR
jgi:1A family penicillin-binding protein